MDNRREFLKKAALLAGATSMVNVLPLSIQKALAINPAEGSTYLDAEHIVLLMQENRSFDHTFGTLRGVRGYNDPRTINLPNQNKVWLQSNDKGETYAPFRLNIKDTKATWMSSLPHSWSNQSNARNDGRFDKWLESKKSSTKEYEDMPLTMGYHTRQDIPFYYSLADAFTVCDQNFCASLTGTNPNRLHFWTGTIRPEQNENSRAHVWNDDMDYGTLNWTTFPERLEQNGISWKCYQNEVSIDTGFDEDGDFWLSNFQDNPLEFFGQYNINLYKTHLDHVNKRANELQAQIAILQKELDALPDNDANKAHKRIQLKELMTDYENVEKDKQNYRPEHFDALTDYQKNLHLKAFDSNTADPHYHTLEPLTYDDNGVSRTLKIPKGDVLYNFRQDVTSGKLPTVSWLSAPQSFSDHPSAPWFGAWYVSEVLDILTQNPEVWKKTIFILAYDENDGYFDHVPPFTAPHSHKPGSGKISAGMDTRVDFVTLEQEQERHDFPEKYDREGPIGLGFRVPLVIASPWSKGGWVNSEVFDHTSTLQFLETFLEQKTGKKITETNISPWRRMICGNLTSIFRPYNSDPIPSPEFVQKDAFIERIYNAKFKKLPDDFKLMNGAQINAFNADPHQFMQQQEKGIKPSNALPYDMHVDGKLSADGRSFEISFVNNDKFFGKSTAGAPFNVYAPGIVKQLNGEFAPLRAWAYAVKPGDTLTDNWQLDDFENSNYHLQVYGPNGFYREFTGSGNAPAISTVFEPQKSLSGKGLTGNALLKITNNTHIEQHIHITDNSYKTNNNAKIIAPGKSALIVLDLAKSYNWYDVSIKVQGHESFTKRYAGRIETGKHSFSDPFMGRG
jgi:phospholipase C